MPNVAFVATPLAAQVAEWLQEAGLTVTIEPYDFEHPGKIPVLQDMTL